MVWSKLPYVWKRRLLALAAVVGLPLAWKAVLLEGPGLLIPSSGAPPAMFRFHAQGLVKGALGYPRPVEGTLPAPALGSSHAAQLALMGWWEGRGWSSKALAQGRVEGRDLKVRLGSLGLLGVTEVSPSRDYNGPRLCQADYRVRWELPEAERELYRVRELVGLRLPAGLRMPGQELAKQVTLERTALGWKVQDQPQLQAQESGRERQAWTWLQWLF